MKNYLVIALAILNLTLVSCNKNDDNDSYVSTDVQIKSFIYRGFNTYYLYKDGNTILNQNFNSNYIGTPYQYFEAIKDDNDRFSFIYHDYEVLEAYFSGISYSNGITYDLYEHNNQYYAVILKVAQGSPADALGLERGQFITKVDGGSLSDSNSNSLSANNSYTITYADYNIDLDTFNEIGTVNITEENFQEDAVTTYSIIEEDGIKVGYLLYDSFIAGSQVELNNIFEEFISNGVTELILDLRYNGGGSVATAVALAQMITGDYTDQVFFREQWNSEAQSYFEENDPESLIGRFKDTFTYEDTEYTINSLHLDQVYILSSKNRTASASEMMINGLSPYIDVVHIGSPEGTVGKSQASASLYDSDTFGKENVNSSHKYVLQPLIFQSVNASAEVVPNDGLTPEISYTEQALNLGLLGTSTEPFLKEALNEITGNNVLARSSFNYNFGNYIGSNKSKSPLANEMYVKLE